MKARRNAMLTLGVLLIGAKSTFARAKTTSKGQMMDEQKFWDLVEQAKSESGNDLNHRPDALEKILSPLPLESIQAFQQRYEHLLIKANTWKLWGAAYVMNGGCSDDGFKYFRDWLISEGRALFERAIEDPDSLSSVPRREYFDLESFGYAALHAYEKNGGGEIYRDFNVELAPPKGEEWQESDLPKLLPKLSASYQH